MTALRQKQRGTVSGNRQQRRPRAGALMPPDRQPPVRGLSDIASAVEKPLAEYSREMPLELAAFFHAGQQVERCYSNTIELYDAIPKYFWGKVRREGGKYLPSIQRQFKHKKSAYQVTVFPARIINGRGEEKDYYPGLREELVEDALRKLACEGRGLFLDQQMSVVFSLYELQQELKQRGHTYNINQIKEALLICARTSIELKPLDGTRELSFTLFANVGLETREDWLQHGKRSRAFVRFNQLVTASIENLTFRQLDYETCMTYRSSLARWFHKRLSHNFIQAGLSTRYTIRLSTILRDSGVQRYAKISNNIRAVIKALDEIREARIITRFTTEKIHGRRSNKIMDAKFVLYPSQAFVREVRRTNAQLQQIAESEELESRRHGLRTIREQQVLELVP
ncbi:MAG: hypothetical protein HQL50_12415 [Magnetococcales bacterium]|nr:hypothetical protein [Magnetococcales bacterium]